MKERPTVPTCLQRARDYYVGHITGGALHIVLDDGNVERGHVEFCLAEARKQRDPDGEMLAEMMLELTEAERQEVYERLWSK